jgi:uncharacterized protein (TIGR03000 family)
MRRTLFGFLFVGATALLAVAAWTASASQQPPVTKSAGPPGAASPAFLVVTVPADAEVEIEGAKTKAVGELRRYQSPPLQFGVKYHYTIKATWKEEGKERTLQLDVPVSAGNETPVDFVKEAKKPAKDKEPVKDKAKDKEPVKDKDKEPVKDKDKPVKDLPAKDTPAKDLPVKDKPVTDKPPPLKDLPVKDKDTPAKDSDK